MINYSTEKQTTIRRQHILVMNSLSVECLLFIIEKAE